MNMLEQLLEKIAGNTRPKGPSMEIILSDNKTEFVERFNPPLQFDKSRSYEMALINLETYYSFPNITKENNRFIYSANGGNDWSTITIPVGCYELDDLNIIIQREMKMNGHWDRNNETYYISFSANKATLRTVMHIGQNYKVNFNQAKTLASVLGFENRIFSQGSYESENPVNILDVSSILVNIDIVQGSYLNGSQSSIIYSFFPNVFPGEKIIQTPHNLVYLPITLDTISKIKTRITDNKDQLLDLRGETITMRFHIREI